MEQPNLPLIPQVAIDIKLQHICITKHAQFCSSNQVNHWRLPLLRMRKWHKKNGSMGLWVHYRPSVSVS
eukprot:scaffold42685_cov20-Tisochrysis_lutea.AAC.1